MSAIVPIPAHDVYVGGAAVIVADHDAAELFREAHRVCAQITEITNGPQCEYAREVMVEVNKLAAAIDKQREVLKKPYLEAGRKIDAAAKAWTAPLAALVSGLKSKLGEYATRVAAAQAQAMIEQALREEAAAAEAKARGAATPALVLDVEIPEAAGVATRTEHDVIIDDIHAIPAEFLAVNVALIKRTILAGNEVPGARLLAKKVVVAR